jgi:hypothetical protein
MQLSLKQAEMNGCLAGSDMNAVEMCQSKELVILETAGLPSDGALGACAWTRRVKYVHAEKKGPIAWASESYASGIRISQLCPKSLCHTHPCVYLVAAFAECPMLLPLP